MVVGEQVAGEIGERPHVRGPAPARGRSRCRGHEPVRRERVEVLAHRGFGEPERGGELARRRLRALEPVDDAALGVAQFARAHLIGFGRSDLTALITKQIIASTASRKYSAKRPSEDSTPGSADDPRGPRRHARRAPVRRSAPHQGRLVAGRRVLARRRRATPSRTAARTSASRSTRAPSSPGSSPATGTTPASTSCRAARSTSGPTTRAASTSRSAATTCSCGARPDADVVAHLQRRLREGLEEDITLVDRQVGARAARRGRRTGRDRADRRRVRRALPRRRLGHRTHHARRDGQPPPPSRPRTTARSHWCTVSSFGRERHAAVARRTSRSAR